MNLAEDYLKYLVAYALQHCDEDLQYFESKDCPSGEADLRTRLRNVLENDFVRITYTQAVELLEQHIAAGTVKFENPVSWGVDLARYVHVVTLCITCILFTMTLVCTASRHLRSLCYISLLHTSSRQSPAYALLVLSACECTVVRCSIALSSGLHSESGCAPHDQSA
jgi:hypothetical protein